MDQVFTTKEQIYQYLVQHQDFKCLDANVLRDLADKATLRVVKRGKKIFNQGKHVKSSYCIVEGHVKIRKLNLEGVPTFITYLEPQAFFSIRTLFGRSEIHHYAADAICDVLLIEIPHQIVRGLVQTQVTFSRALLNRVHQMFDTVERRMQEIGSSSAQVRIEQTVFLLKENHARYIKETIRIPFKISLAELALMSGTTRETTSQVVKKMEHENTIKYQNKIFSFVG
ncbi:Crp/Fnr family transcriptional regulator [Pediococcus claussenii]|uniref:Cyclic nucleotide-binding domain protein n=1 Tax=Pediococcus claussenii (strain ATCC BAA-344 / DSM 14800 / JCM 18046 / KCTC 3811 / LMG 21948 / P06) TaxID=701521 RepID=G8PDT8_PEDCP|nr:Crp/Fnr family transcriptional regulator [Pediococcus claussenii]AEV95423.1 cyclic nucleotide-binding domain protein [Pediococcus claussenii ATCC BAA-344]ANZ68953.1 hypothetical protein AYR57_00825 [Pediococcus claussenii]ANZ70769.1 hypothetical protein AYR58_00825 [Pediococcus claussenii]KRN19066.1 hypothetical protein IV79_GL001728 [Pediococcus claussenii]